MSNKQSPNSGAVSQSGGGSVSTLTAGLSASDYALPFFHYLTIPKNTTQSIPEIYNLVLPKGVLHRIVIETPRGCAGLAGMQLWHGEQQIFPLPSGVWFRSDNSVLPFQLTHYFTYEPFEVKIKGYNDDDTYSHTIWVALEMAGQESDLTSEMLAFLKEIKG